MRLRMVVFNDEGNKIFDRSTDFALVQDTKRKGTQHFHFLKAYLMNNRKDRNFIEVPGMSVIVTPESVPDKVERVMTRKGGHKKPSANQSAHA